ncbi:MAG TPA: hypothetical protein HPQ03_18075 [Deltaproteobacteria bacterium]|nr:hypothetical protein [Deltaproteobacteria bacterium]
MSKKSFFLIFCIFLSSCYSTSTLNLQTPVDTPYDHRHVIAVVDFQNKSGEPDNDKLIEGITGTIISELQGTKQFRLIERQRLKSILAELKLNSGGLVDAENAKEIGNLLGVEALLFGNLSAVKYSRNKQTIFIAWTEGQRVDVDLDARLVSVETGEVLAASKASSFVKQRNWVAFWFAKLGEDMDKNSIIQTGIDLNCKQLANDLADKTPSKSQTKGL